MPAPSLCGRLPVGQEPTPWAWAGQPIPMCPSGWPQLGGELLMKALSLERAELQPTVSQIGVDQRLRLRLHTDCPGSLGTLLSRPRRRCSPRSRGCRTAALSGVARASLFCLVPGDRLKWLDGLDRRPGLAASGWRPRWTAVPHWWVTFGLAHDPDDPGWGRPDRDEHDAPASPHRACGRPEVALGSGPRRRTGWSATHPLVSWSAGLVIRPRWRASTSRRGCSQVEPRRMGQRDGSSTTGMSDPIVRPAQPGASGDGA